MYATAAQLIQYIDSRLIGDLCSDNNTRVSPTGILTDPNVALALSTAAGVINSAALIAGRYTVAQLAALSGDDAHLLAQMNAWLAFGQLCERRGRDPQEQPTYKQTLESLDRLRKGQNIFNVQANVDAGVPQQQFMTQVQWSTVNTIRSATFRYYPTRRTQQTTS